MSKISIDIRCLIPEPDGTPTDCISDAYAQAEVDENGDLVEGTPILWTLYGASGQLAFEAPMDAREAYDAVLQSGYPEDEQETLLSLIDLVEDAFAAHAYDAEGILPLAQEKGLVIDDIAVHAE